MLLQLMLVRVSFKQTLKRGGNHLRKLFYSLLRGLAAGLVLYGRYTCGIYWNDANDWYALLYGESQETEQAAGVM